MLQRLTLLTISFVLPSVLYSCYGSYMTVSYYPILKSAFCFESHSSDSISTYSNPITQSTDPGGSGRIDTSIKGKLS
jgi:hypothetical protein